MSKRIKKIFLGQFFCCCHLDQNNGSISILTLLDLSAAFDIIDYSILLTRLENAFGICDLALSFFDFYMQGRTQVVTVNEVKSPSLLTCGVPRALPRDQFFSFCILSLFLMQLVTTLSLIICLRMILNCTELILLLKQPLSHGPSNPAFQM